MKLLSALITILLLSVCSLDPAQMSTEKLCARYTAPLSSQRHDPALRDELVKRGAHSWAIHSAASPLPPLEYEAYMATKASE